jgi:15-cis-phytoene synthase
MNLSTAYAECERITTEQARNFSYGIKLLPPPKRRSLSAVYAFARRVDDIGDGDESPEQRLTGLAEVREQLHRLDRPGDDPVLVALADTALRTGLPIPAFHELIDGCEADVRGTRYETFDQLHHYCRFGSDDRLSAEPLADALGVGLQLTNILRDVLEDRRNGRIYLPAEDLDRFGCTLELDQHGAFTDDEDALTALIEFEAARAQEWYAEGLQLLPMLDRRSRACCAAMSGIYRRLLDRFMARPWLVLRDRVSLPGWEKAVVAARSLAGAAR